jgi:hypothetical protein
MNSNLYILGISTILFLTVGGVVDYWQSARHHNKPIPRWLKDYFALFWLILYTGLLPFMLVVSASDFDADTVKIYLGFFFIGMTCWDIVFSYLQSGKFVVSIKDYWFWGKKDYGLTKNQIILWHALRLAVGLMIIL